MTRIGAEFDAALGVKLIDSLEQPDRPFLHEIVQRFAQPAKSARDTLYQVQMLADKPVTHDCISRCVKSPKLLL
jgi:hypothetical protein